MRLKRLKNRIQEIQLALGRFLLQRMTIAASPLDLVEGVVILALTTYTKLSIPNPIARHALAILLALWLGHFFTRTLDLRADNGQTERWVRRILHGVIGLLILRSLIVISMEVFF